MIAQIIDILKTNEVVDLTLDSREVVVGGAFIALLGNAQDGHKYIDDAWARGACCVVQEGDSWGQQQTAHGDLLTVPQLRNQLGDLAQAFYDYPSRQLKVVGVTGTNGKTTIAYLLWQLCGALGLSCGYIGTIGHYLGEGWSEQSLTTPDAITLAKMMHRCVAHHVQVLAMEVSAHALSQYRVDGIDFFAGVWSNLSQDHLDYYGTMQVYGEAKKRLFTQLSPQIAVINQDDLFCAQQLHDIPGQILTYGASSQASWHYTYKRHLPQGYQITVRDAQQSWDMEIPLLGEFNIGNALAACMVMHALGMDKEAIGQAMAAVHAPAGRMQLLQVAGQPQVIIDYAHTPDALQQTLRAMIHHYPSSKLFVVFGCGGERDRAKRPQMMRVVYKAISDCWGGIVITDDNPRYEDPKRIVEDIVADLSADIREQLVVEHDRAKAIAYAIEHASAADVVLIAGKGHETCFYVGGERYVFSDWQCAQDILHKK